jgi:hypothetical protein
VPGDSAESEDEQFSPSEPRSSGWPRRQAYFVTVEWLDEPHRPASPEPLAQAIRHALEHAHSIPAGAPPARFIVRVKADAVAAEVEGTVEHHHHHHA